MKVVGITGGVGSGKSEVLRLLEEKFNCGVIRTDDVARDLCEPGEKSYELIVKNFGETVLDMDGRLNRPKLASIVFEDEAKRQLLNQCTHPQVYEWVREKVREWRTKKDYSMIAVEAALMDELKEIGVCESYWYVYVKPEIRRERLRISRGYSDEKMDAIFASQLPEAVFLNGCDVVIDNNFDLENVEKQLKSLCK
ncbi:dephospho-CoA kinase [Frisingicoccus sp.]|uniref:dephospho-CoA kinase n=1 Tax=Frisingicoccus sp. TaxID=1918627 RepID=UPI003AB8F7AA